MPLPQAAGPEPFGKYLLDREIARGGMARVHLARLRGLGGFEKRLVVKQILPHLASDPRFVSMFIEEAKTLVQMSHPHIVPVYELGVVDGVYFLAMDYIEGATLADVLEEGPLPAAQVAHIGVQICDALSYAHERFGIVHRDVTPRNVIVDAAGHCRLLDFGIAAPASEIGEPALFGTPGYLSPEQARGETVGPASDLFGLGAVLWHALRGAPPFDPGNLDRVRALRAGSTDQPRLVGCDGVDPELATIVDGLLDPDPAARPESARAVGRSLRGWLAARHPEGVGPELGARSESARRRREQPRASDVPRLASSTSRVEPTGKVRTSAQSQALEELLGRTSKLERTTGAAEPASVRTLDAAPVAADTAPPEVASARTPSEPSPVTVPIAGRSARHRAFDAAPTSDAAPGTKRATTPQSRPAMLVPLALAIGAIIAVVVVWNTGPRDPEPRFGPAGLIEPAAARFLERTAGEAAGASEEVSPPSQGPLGEPRSSEQEDRDHRASRVPEAAADQGHRRLSDSEVAGVQITGAERRARSARLAITARGWADVTLDGRRLGTTPIRDHRIAPGRHVLVARNPTLASGEARATFEAEPNARLHVLIDFDAPLPITLAVRN